MNDQAKITFMLEDGKEESFEVLEETKINGINVETVAEVQTIISKMKAGDKIVATVARANSKGELDSIDIEIELSESAQ